MSIFSDLMNRMCGHAAPALESKVNAAVAANAPAASVPQPSAAAVSEVDVEVILESMSSGSSQKLDWRHSIVDLMKLVGMESGLAQRKALAQELATPATRTTARP